MVEKKPKKKIEDCITENGILVSGQGILAENTKKIIELLEKIDKKLFFLERRQQQWFEKIYPEMKRDYQGKSEY